MGHRAGADDERTPDSHDHRAPLPGCGPASAGVGIGEAARRVGLAPSAIRFYEQEGLLAPAPQPNGRRRYDDEALRRLAFVAMGREMGLDLAAIRSVLDPAPGEWRPAVDAQIAHLDERIARLQHTRAVLEQARECPADDPVRDCPHLGAALDAGLGGTREDRPRPDPKEPRGRVLPNTARSTGGAGPRT